MSFTTLALVLLLLLLALPALAGGQALGIAHPVLDPKVDKASPSQYEQYLEPVMALSEEQLRGYVPEWTYIQYVECPNCYGGVEGNGIFTWDRLHPEQMTCRYCKTVYPNAKYPETEVLTGKNLLGETVSLPYHKSPEGVTHYLSLQVAMLKRRWLTEQVTALARAYVATGKEAYARRVAVILDQCAQRYPHYPVIQNLPRRIAFREQKAPWPWDSGRWNFFHNNIPIELLPAYDMIYLSPEFDKLSAERGYDVREKIEKDFLKPSCEEIMVRKDHINNCVGYDVRSAALLGRIINEPRYVHWAYGWMQRNLTEGFMRDGFWMEGSPSYHGMTVGGLKYALEAVKGYTDPAGYKDAVDGTRYENLDPDKDFPFWGMCQTAPNAINTPNGYSAVVHDSWFYERRGAPRAETVSTIMPAVGHASLGRGRGPDQMQAQLHFSGGYGHQHNDNLNLMLWAKGKEMLPDLGYTWTQMRTWTTSSVCHNLVVVDRQSQGGYPSDGNLLAYYPGDTTDPDAVEVGMVEADGKLGYSRLKDLDLYQRQILTIPVSAGDAYVVDIFRLRGGTTHDWALHGDADEDVTTVCSLPLGEARPTMLLPEEKWVEPQQEAHTYPPYGMLREMRPAAVTGSLDLEFKYAGEGQQGYRLHMLPCGGGELLLGKAPSVRRMGGGTNGDMRKGYDFWMPLMLLRRTGEGPLTSVFTAVHEPYAGKPFLGQTRPLKLTPAVPLAVALEVTCGPTVDTIISLPPGAPAVTTETGITLNGRAAVVRRVKGAVTALWLFDGAQVSGQGFGLKAETAGYDGDLTGATRHAEGAAQDALLTSAKLPLGETLKGRWLIVTYPGGITQGFEIEKTEAAADGQTAVVTKGDHGLRIQGDKLEEAYFPLRKLTGKATFHLGGIASVVRRPDGLVNARATSPVEVTMPR